MLLIRESDESHPVGTASGEDLAIPALRLQSGVSVTSVTFGNHLHTAKFGLLIRATGAGIKSKLRVSVARFRALARALMVFRPKTEIIRNGRNR
jgi:hypothetical protein